MAPTLTQLQAWLAQPNIMRALDLIAWAEGTNNRYDILFGNGSFNVNGPHPNRVVAGRSTAAGRYQFLYRTWQPIARQYGFSDMRPAYQDLAAVYLINYRGAINDLLAGNLANALPKISWEWASLPPSRYGQGRLTTAQVLAKWNSLGGPAQNLLSTTGSTAGNAFDQLAQQLGLTASGLSLVFALGFILYTSDY